MTETTAMGDFREIVTIFVAENREILEKLERDIVELERRPDDLELVASVFRGVHTIKGTSGFLGFTRLMAMTHAGESLLVPLRDGHGLMTPEIAGALLALVDAVRQINQQVEQTSGEGTGDDAALLARLAAAGAPPVEVRPSETPGEVEALQPPSDSVHLQAAPEPHEVDIRAPGAGDRSVRVDVDLLDRLMNLSGELILSRNRFIQAIGTPPPQAAAAAQRLSQVANELQETVTRTRMQPIGALWRRFPRLVRDLALEVGKKVRLDLEGEHTELDRSVIEALRDPLVHLLRNAVDHGIERPAARAAQGKDEEGRLLLRAFHEGGQVIIEFADDGRGIDVARIKSRALAAGMITRDRMASMKEQDALEMIFAPGFSTADAVTKYSGRGVGMDVVKRDIERIGGSVEVTTRTGRGALFRMKIPLTLAIIPALVVRSKDQRFAIPQGSVREVFVVRAEEARKRVEVVHSVAVVRLRGALLPLVFLDDQLHLGSSFDAPADESLTVVVLQAEGRRFGLVVDGVVDAQDIVIRPLGPYLRGVPVYSGAAILSDGAVALILDVPGLGRRASIPEGSAAEEEPPEASPSITTRSYLVLAGRDGGRMAAPIDHVLRLEEFPRSAVERMGGRDVVQFRGRVMPLVDPSAAPAGDEPVLQVVVFGRNDRFVGLIVNRILDIAEEMTGAMRPGARPGVLGSLVVRDKVTEVLDIPAILVAADPEFFGDAVDSVPPWQVD